LYILPVIRTETPAYFRNYSDARRPGDERHGWELKVLPVDLVRRDEALRPDETVPRRIGSTPGNDSAAPDPVRANAGACRDRTESTFSSFLFFLARDDYSCKDDETWLACMGAMFYDSNVRRSYGGPIPEAIWKIYSAQAFGARRNG
jgi:hypothetical protein